MGRPVIHALVAAAGRGSRFGGSVLKQYMPVQGRPVLGHAIDAVNVQPWISGITVVLSADDRRFNEVVNHGIKRLGTVTGGDTRHGSVMNGLAHIRRNFRETEWVMVHDAARPCLRRDLVVKLIEQGVECEDGAILAVPVSDSLKMADEEGRIESGIDRSRIWAAQTPQLFPLRKLTAALDRMSRDGHSPTDEASAMEYIGARPRLVMGSVENIKITWPEDIGIAEAWFQRTEAQRQQ